jgi:hypothetical protein
VPGIPYRTGTGVYTNSMYIYTNILYRRVINIVTIPWDRNYIYRTGTVGLYIMGFVNPPKKCFPNYPPNFFAFNGLKTFWEGSWESLLKFCFNPPNPSQNIQI